MKKDAVIKTSLDLSQSMKSALMVIHDEEPELAESLEEKAKAQLHRDIGLQAILKNIESIEDIRILGR